MKKSLAAFLLVAVGAAMFAAGSWVGWRSATSPAGDTAARKVLYYTCPMHPAYHSDKAGDCPSCGMRLTPVYTGTRPGSAAGSPLPDTPGLVQISAERQQIIGIRTGQVESRPAAGTIRTAGRVTVDENRVFRLLAASDGLVRRIFSNSTGSLVRKNEPLLEFYTREFLGAEQAYLFALQSYDRFVEEDASADQVNVALTQIRSTIDTLQNMGMGDVQIAALARSRTVTTDIELRSPVDGCVLARNVTPLQRFDRGAELYRIADLSRVWILADVTAREAYPLQPGTRVHISAPYIVARTMEARVADILPQFDAAARTLKLRLEAENADYALRPDMFVEVELPVSLPSAVTVPVDALVDSGLRKIVFVDRGNGYFEPRRVEVGWRFEDRVEIVKGLMPGERIVLSGTFLLDSESRMRAAAMGVVTPRQDPVCGMEVDEAKAKAAGRMITHAGRTYFFCSDQCRKDFEANPSRYTQSDRAAEAAVPVVLQPFSFRNNPYANLPGLESVPGGTLASPPPVITRPRPLGVPRAPGASPAPAQAPESAPGDDVGASRPPVERKRISRDPACGLPVVEEAAAARGLVSQFQGRTFFFSSADCKKAFDEQPAQYLAGVEPVVAGAQRPRLQTTPAGPRNGSAMDPVCGKVVDPKQAAAAGLRSTYQGTAFFFCSDDCKKAFEKDPARYVRK